MMRLTLTPCSLIIAVLLGNNLMFASSMSLYRTTVLVSDLPTPSFLIDMDMLHKASASIHTVPLRSPSSSASSSSSSEKNPEITYPCLSLPKHGIILVPHPQSINTARRIDSADNNIPTPNKSNPPYDVSTFRGQSALAYIHASVSVSKSCPVGKETHSRDGTFLAEIDVSYGLGRNSQLVMGINNHHVGSYYWARSVGMGASMEAPGVTFRKQRWDDDGGMNVNNGNGMLCWEGSGPLDCNSNDGKRSEWVNFVKVGDLVQLLPECLEESLMDFMEMKNLEDEKVGNIYGFSSRGRPLGSEPVVVCQWKTEDE